MARQYTLPQVIVQQDFALIPAAATQELLAVVIGPQKKIISLDDPDDANYVTYGDYKPNANTQYTIKGLDTTDVLYSDSVVVTLKDVKAKYATLSGSTGVTVFKDAVAAVHRNKISLGSSIVGGFTKYGSLPRASVFSNRDVEVGDKVSITPAGGATLDTRVLEIINEVVPASAGAFSADTNNKGTAISPAIVTGTGAYYIGSSNTTYEVRVVKGGDWADGPQVVVLTSNGIDSYGVQTISSSSAQFNLGSLGVQATFGGGSQTGLTEGDKFYVTVTAATKGATSSLRLADTLPDSVVFATALVVNFYLNKSSVAIPAVGYPVFGSEAWSLSDTLDKITINSGIEVLDSTWVDGSGIQVPLEVASAEVFIEYKALVRELSNQLTTFNHVSSVNAVLGSIVPDNTLAYGVEKALLNSAGHTVYAVAVESDDLEGYIKALEVTEGEVKNYYIVPLTSDEQIILLVKGHVLSLSDPAQAMERIAIVNKEFSPSLFIYDKKSDVDESWSGYVEKSSYSGLYDFVTIPGATLLTDGVRIGDIFRSNFGIDSYGNTTYDSFLIRNVVDEDHLEVESPGFDTSVGNASQLKTIQIVRSLSKDEQAAVIAANSAELGNRRVVNIWPDYAMDGTSRVAGYFVAAAIAGLKSSVAPHQPLTNVTLNGFTDITRSAGHFTPTQLNAIAGGGTWIVTKMPIGATDTTSSAAVGSIVTRHQLTTDYTDDNMAEVSITTNLDSISKWLRDDLKVIIGQYNNHPYMLQLIRTRLEYRLTYLQGNARTLKSGPQLISYKINSVTVDPDSRTTVNADVDLVLPYPINNINLKLTVV